MSTPEGKVKARVKELLNEHGAYHHWPVQTGYGEPTLDCVGCHRGKYFAIETKAPGEQLTPRQNFTKEKMEAAGAKVFVVGEHWLDDYGQKEFYSGETELEAWLLLHS
jgi:cytochrome c1